MNFYEKYFEVRIQLSFELLFIAFTKLKDMNFVQDHFSRDLFFFKLMPDFKTL